MMWVVYLTCDDVAGRLPLFYERDESFRAYVKDSPQVAENSRGELSVELDKVFRMFSHLILANKQLATPYGGVRHLECANGFKVVFKTPTEGVILIAGSSSDVGDDLSALEVEQRLETLLSLLRFLYGPSFDYHLSLISSLKQKQASWDEISLLLNKWTEIYTEEQCYLVEAVEELSMTSTGAPNKGGRTTDASSETFETVLNIARRIIKTRLGCTYDYVMHSMLVVENKIVKFNSSEKDRLLSPYDMLLVLLVSMSYFPSNLVPEDLFSQPQKKEAAAGDDPVADSEDDLLDEVPSNVEAARYGDRYFSNIILEEEPSDTPSMKSAFSTEGSGFTTISSSDSPGSGTTRKYADFKLGDEKLTINPGENKVSETSNSDNNDNEVALHTQLSTNNHESGIMESANSVFTPIANTEVTANLTVTHTDNLQGNHQLPAVDNDLKSNLLNIANHALPSENIQRQSTSSDSGAAQSGELLTENKVEVEDQNGTPQLQTESTPEFDQSLHLVVSEAGGFLTVATSKDTSDSDSEPNSGCKIDSSALKHDQSSPESQDGDGKGQSALNSSNGELLGPIDGLLTENVNRLVVTDDLMVPVGDLPDNQLKEEGEVYVSSPEPSYISANLECIASPNLVSFDDNTASFGDDYASISSVETLSNDSVLTSDTIYANEDGGLFSEVSRGRSVTECIREGCSSPDSAKQMSPSPNSGFLSACSGHSDSLGALLTNHSPGDKIRIPTLSKSFNAGKGVDVEHITPRRGMRKVTSMDSGIMSGNYHHIDTPPMGRRAPSWDSSQQRKVRHQSMGTRRDSATMQSDKDEEYYSAPTPPPFSPSAVPRRPSGDSEASFHSSAPSHFKAAAGSLLDTAAGSLLDTISLLSRVQSRSDDAHMAKDVFVHMRVFLRSSMCDYIPACLYVVSISKGINVIVAAEITDPLKPNKLVEVMNQLCYLLHPVNGPENKHPAPERVVEKMADRLKEVFELVSARDPTQHFKKFCATMLDLWLIRTAPALRKFYRSSSNIDRREIEGVEGHVITLLNNMKYLFRALYMPMNKLAKDMMVHFESLQYKVSRKLAVYKLILLVKAKRNLAMSAFENEKYPGLVHFIYVYRNKNILKSPSVEQPAEDGTIQADIIRDMKTRLWRIVPWMYRQLANGYTSMSVKDGDFIFTFDLFMYDEVHYKFLSKMLTPPSLYTPPKIAIGDLRGQFYKRLLQITDTGAGYKCLELLTVHFAVMPRELIKRQRRQLLVNELHKKHDPFGN